MKRFIAIVLCMILLLSCAACGAKTQDIDQPGTNDPLINAENPGQDKRGGFWLL